MKRTKVKPAWMLAGEDERARFNAAIQNGAVVKLHTFSGEYVVDYVNEDWWYITHDATQPRGMFNQHHWCGCNDSKWADLMRQAGVERNALWAHL